MAMEGIFERERVFPSLASVKALNGRYGLRLSTTDGWRGKIDLHSEPQGYTIISYGRCGDPDPLPRAEGTTVGFEADIVFRNGEFVQLPR